MVLIALSALKSSRTVLPAQTSGKAASSAEKAILRLKKELAHQILVEQETHMACALNAMRRLRSTF